MILAALGVGAGAGFVNGILAARFGLPSFIVTLGMLEVLRSIGLVHFAVGAAHDHPG